MNSGIYYIKCLINNKKYIGSAVNLKDRKSRHFGSLKRGHHGSRKGYISILQEDVIRFGIENFVFEIIEELPAISDNDLDYLNERENYWMDYYQTYTPNYGFKYGYNQKRATRHKNKDKKKLSNSLSKGQFKGENNPMFNKPSPKRLKDEIYFAIKEELLKLNPGEFENSYIIIANKFNTSKANIKAIKTGKHWACKELLNGGFNEWRK